MKIGKGRVQGLKKRTVSLYDKTKWLLVRRKTGYFLKENGARLKWKGALIRCETEVLWERDRCKYQKKKNINRRESGCTSTSKRALIKMGKGAFMRRWSALINKGMGALIPRKIDTYWRKKGIRVKIKGALISGEKRDLLEGEGVFLTKKRGSLESRRGTSQTQNWTKEIITRKGGTY